MKNIKEMWDSRFGEEGYAYGDEPNKYFADKLKDLPIGKILLPAEGEGRNAIYAASLGWNVHAFDISENAKLKAESLANEKGVHIKYDIIDIDEIKLKESDYDVIGLIYAHFPTKQKRIFFEKLNKALKFGGYIIFEAFSKSHLEINKYNQHSMGPRNLDQLYSVDEIKNIFRNYAFTEIAEEEIILNEGKYHKGSGSVIRFLAKKVTV